MKKKFFIIALVFVVFGLRINAQTVDTTTTPVEIQSITIEKHPLDWYEQQSHLWEKCVLENPQNEYAWHNYFKSVFYHELQADTVSSVAIAEVCRKMGEAIPNTYRYYYCMYRNLCLNHQLDSADIFAQKALEALPDSIQGDEINTLIAFLWYKGVNEDPDSKQYECFLKLLQKQYEAPLYPEKLFRYMYNQFQGMEDNGIYFFSGDNAGFPAIILQNVLNVHKDKQVVCVPFLYLESYCDALFKRLGIKPFKSADDYLSMNLSLELWMSDLIQYIIRESGRPGYFCGVEMYYLPDTLTHFLYNEGLLLRYSPKPYDNIASTKKIVETKYHLEYLNEPEFTPSNKHPEYEGMQLNYVMMLSHLIPFYRADGEKEKALWLQQLLTDVINNTQVNENFKRHCFQILDENTNLDENTK
ncbi:MAG: hypothetical protein MJZ57_03260 [Bacteroidales bacterium]|nr:hypothetical protein [Bacteroidales bacterium]